MAVKIDKGFAYGNINMTPMIDCVFLLLIFFLVATKFEEAERELPIVLPQASEARPLTSRPRELFVNVLRTGEFKINGQAVAVADLLAAVKQHHANNPGDAVVIRADEGVEFKHVVAVMNACNQAEHSKYIVATANDIQ